MTKQPPAFKFFCAPCNQWGPTREWLAAHRQNWLHKTKVTMTAFASKGWAPVRDGGTGTSQPAKVFVDAGIPCKTAEYVDPDAPRGSAAGKLDKFGRGEFVTYVPQCVADACAEWRSLPTATKRVQPLSEYLKVMFAAVNWDEVNAAEVERARLKQEGASIDSGQWSKRKS